MENEMELRDGKGHKEGGVRERQRRGEKAGKEGDTVQA